VALNGLSNVCLEKLAISDRTGSHLLQLAVHKHNGQNTLCQEFAYEGVNSGITETVSLTTLDQYVLEKGISRIDLIKLDIEGAEYQAFLGAKNTLATLRPALVFEIVKSALQKNRINIRDLEEFLNAMNYNTFSIDEQTAHLVPKPLSEMKDGNAVALPHSNLGLIQD
jgi:FkbM family methyltransferase